MKLQDRVRATPRDEVVIEEKKIKCYGENYQAVIANHRVSLKKMISLVFGCLILSAVVLLVLVLCGV